MNIMHLASKHELKVQGIEDEMKTATATFTRLTIRYVNRGARQDRIRWWWPQQKTAEVTVTNE